MLQSYSGKEVEITAVNDVVVASLTNLNATVVNQESTDGLYDVPYCRDCLAELHRASQCILNQLQFHFKVIQNSKEKLEILPRRK